MWGSSAAWGRLHICRLLPAARQCTRLAAGSGARMDACRLPSPALPTASQPTLPNRPTAALPQVKARPPTFVAWVSGSTPLSVSSQRFLAGLIRRQFGFSGVPIRIQVRSKQPRRQRGKGGGGRGRR